MTKQDPGDVWDSLPTIARVALCEISEVVEGKVGSAPWEKVSERHRNILTPLLIDDDAVAVPVPKDTDNTDRSVRLGWSSGKPVYRGSMSGHCLKELFLWRIGTGELLTPRDESAESQDPGILAAKEGTRHEKWIIEDLAMQGYELAWTGEDQQELERRYKRFVIRSHPDGMIRGKELGETWHVLEAKSMSEDRFGQWMALGWNGFQNYAHQVSLEMDLSAKPAFFVAKNRNTGKMEKMIVTVAPVPPARIIRKFSKIEDIIDAASEGIEPAAPNCSPNAEWFWCPFFNLGKCDILQGEDAADIEEIEDDAFAGILRKYKQGKLMIKEGEALVEALRESISERMVKPRLKINSFFVALSERQRAGFNIPKAKQRLLELGEDPTEYDKVSTYTELRVTGGEADMEEPEKEGETE